MWIRIRAVIIEDEPLAASTWRNCWTTPARSRSEGMP